MTPRVGSTTFAPGPPPLRIVGGSGNDLHTDDGRTILDGAGGAVVNCIGYGRPEVADAAAAALRDHAYVLPTMATPARDALAERLLDRWLPEGMTRAMFVAGGSESVDTAMRIARQHHVARGDHDRWKIIGRETSYHGSTLATLAVANHDRRRAPFGPLLLDLPKIDVYDAERSMKQIEAEDPATVAAVIGEPVIGAAGAAIVPPDDYWPTLRRYCADHGILFIADEVMTGVGRTGERFAVDHWGITPDILVGSKGLGGGYVPIGGVFATEAVVAPMTERIMYFTFSGANVSCAVADCVLQIIEDEDLVERASTQGALLRSMLEDRLGDHPHVADIRGLGLLQGVELTRDRELGGAYGGALTNAVVEEALARDCWIYPAGTAGVPDALLYGPAYTVTDAELERLVDVTVAALDAALARPDLEP